MQVITEITQLRKALSSLRQGSIALVPTMGYLHEGHLALVAAAKAQNDTVVMSIFVNPTQFGPNEDFESYPRDLARDSKLAAEAGVDFIFAPSVEEIYPVNGSVVLQAGAMASKLCGASRPTHFDGVVQVVAKLFNIVQPTRAYFGQKDAQQLAIIETMVRDFNFPIEICAVPIVREADGLAKSSRNVYLTKEQRDKAPAIYKELTRLQQGKQTREATKEAIERATGGKIDYLTKLAYPDLTEPTASTKRFVLAVAVFVGKTRLIDNIIWEVV